MTQPKDSVNLPETLHEDPIDEALENEQIDEAQEVEPETEVSAPVKKPRKKKASKQADPEALPSEVLEAQMEPQDDASKAKKKKTVPFYLYDKRVIEPLMSRRPSEQKLGDVIHLGKYFARTPDAQAKFALIGIPEDIGPKANAGRPGAQGGWDAFLRNFLNLVVNGFVNPKEVVLMGEVNTEDLQARGTRFYDWHALRMLCEQLDYRVRAAINWSLNRNLIPIVIGGGHNNALPIIQSVSERRGAPVSVLNIDPHADFRPIEGRHSGNPFHYAYQSGHMNWYHIWGLQSQVNSNTTFDALKNAGFDYTDWVDIIAETLDENVTHLQQIIEKKPADQPFGLEIDLDSITDMPTSAMSPFGFDLREIFVWLQHITASYQPTYLHLAEGAPSLGADGDRTVGKALAQMVYYFIKSY